MDAVEKKNHDEDGGSKLYVSEIEKRKTGIINARFTTAVNDEVPGIADPIIKRFT